MPVHINLHKMLCQYNLLIFLTISTVKMNLMMNYDKAWVENKMTSCNEMKKLRIKLMYDKYICS